LNYINGVSLVTGNTVILKEGEGLMPSKKKVSEPIVMPDFRPSEFCMVCYLVFGSHENRVLVGDKAVHSRCARGLSKTRAA
jgi:hypothetical protein